MFFAPTVDAYTCSPRAWDRHFERFVKDALTRPAQRSLQIQQDDKNWTLSLDVPGLAREDLNVSIEGAVVRIESKAEAKRQVRVAYELPLEIDAAASQAKLENGVLELKLAKKLPESKVRVLAVQ